MTLPPPNICRQICALHALMGSPHDGEAQSARDMLIRMLAEHGLTWNDLAAILAAADAADSVDAVNDGATDGASPDEAASVPNLLDLVMRLIAEHVAVSSAERMAVALWALHTHVYDLYDVTPRLAFRSPTSECGKTTVLISLEHFVRNPYRADDVTAASIYTELHQNPHISLLLDEGDNLGLFENRVLRAVLNSGHRRGGRVARVIRGESRWLPTFVPVAIAAIGKLPLPLLRRSIVIEMTRRASDQPPLRRLDESDPAFAVAREEIVRWAASVQLARDPAIPPQLRNRAADNWRVLLAIADSLGYGEAARAVAIELSANHPNEDVVVRLLADIRTIFLARRADRLASAILVADLNALEDSPWPEWRGLHGHRLPRPLTQPELATLLRPFGIRPRTVWPTRRQPGDKSTRGYLRADFEAVWAAYCDSADMPSQASEIISFARS